MHFSGLNHNLKAIQFFLLTFILLEAVAADITSAREVTTQDIFEIPFEELMDVKIISATQHSTKVQMAPAIAKVITADEIKKMGARNILDVLRRISSLGIFMSEHTLKQGIEVRGIRTKNSEKILFLLDGHRLNNNIFGSGLNVYSKMSVENIKRIEVITGPGSALYGANAFLGVINIITKSAEDIDNVEMTVGLGDDTTQHYNVLFGFLKNEIEVSGTIDVLDTDGPEYFIESDAQTISDEADGTNASLAPGYTDEWLEQTDCALNFKYKNLYLNNKILNKKTGPYIGAGRALNDETELEWQQLISDLNYQNEVGDKLNYKIRAYFDYLIADNYWEIYPEGWKGVYPDGLIGNPSTKHHIYGGELTLHYSLSAHLLTIGYNYEYIKQFDTESRTNFHPLTYAPLGSFQNISSWGNWNRNVHRSINAVYVQDVWEILDHATLTIGNRYDAYSDMGDTNNTRAGFVCRLIDRLYMKALYGSAFRAPTFTELYTQNNPSEAGNPDLNPETVNTYELGLQYRLLDNYDIKISYFYTKIEDIITVAPKSSSTDPAYYINSGEAIVDGVESELMFKLLTNTTGYLNFTYQNPRDSDGNRLTDVPEWRSNSGLNVVLTKHINTNINVSWTGKRARDDADNRECLSSMTLVDLTLISGQFYKTTEIRTSVYNVFDEDYRDPSPYPTLVENDYPQNGRSFICELRYHF